MAELWQLYGSWVLYGLAVALMILLHGGMHRGHAHGESGKTPTRDHRGCC